MSDSVGVDDCVLVVVEYEDEDAYGINAEDEVAMSPTTGMSRRRMTACCLSVGASVHVCWYVRAFVHILC